LDALRSDLRVFFTEGAGKEANLTSLYLHFIPAKRVQVHATQRSSISTSYRWFIFSVVDPHSSFVDLDQTNAELAPGLT
jgi:hypothetical protein